MEPELDEWGWSFKRGVRFRQESEFVKRSYGGGWSLLAAVEACGVLFEAMLVNVKAIVNLGVVPLVQFQEADLTIVK